MSRTIDTQAPSDSSGHVHHWRIEEANGPISYGRCKTCAGQKAFRNWLLETDFTTQSEHELAA